MTTATLPAFTRRLHLAPVWAQALAVLFGTAIVAASAQVTVPMVPVPMTMQTYAVLLIGALYGARLGFVTLAVYLAEGAAGLPVFAGGAGGLLHLSGPTAGFLIGFPVAAFVAGWAMERGFGRSLVTCFAALLAAHAVVFAFGVPWLAVIIGWEKAIAAGFVPFILGTLVKSALATASYEAATRIGARTGAV
jgi:biotin transport system substrate-specific component